MRKTPWKMAPDTARPAPTRAAESTRGRRTCHTRLAAMALPSKGWPVMRHPMMENTSATEMS